MMDPAFEIRKLKPSQVHVLVLILETHELWKKLMSIIPKNLHRFEYSCDSSNTNPHKYNSEHFRIIENASMKTKRSCTEIFLEEWGISGRVLPTVGHLLYLLTKAKLFRAADYVAESLLHQPKPQRPDQGPEAPVPIDSPSKLNNKTADDIEKLLDEIDYPSSAVEEILRNNSRNDLKLIPPVIPEIKVTLSVSNDQTSSNSYIPKTDNNKSDMINFSLPSIKSETVSNSKVQSKYINGNIKKSYSSCRINESTPVNSQEVSAFPLSGDKEYLPNFSLMNGLEALSSECSMENPAISELLSEKNSETSEKNIPLLSALGDSETVNGKNPETSEKNIPLLSALGDSGTVNGKNPETSERNFPLLSALGDSGTENEKNPETSEENMPRLSTLVDSETAYEHSFCVNLDLMDPQRSNSFSSPTPSSKHSRENPAISELSNPETSQDNIPHLSALGDSGTVNEHSFLQRSDSFSSDEYNSSSNGSKNIPMNKSKLILGERTMNKSNSSIESLTGNENKSKSYSINVSETNPRSCNSPLPQLSLNTLLPHFNYSDLMKATNDFNTDLYIDEVASGRFLGSGAFGSVFLAFGLMEQPVAVKKLVLENVDYVDIDATVTKQFRNEVEILGHHKHPNLLPLVGYSCDGCTYCLLYEYVRGGALNVRLQAKSNKLQWKQRLKIAVGTANAIAYLHTAFSTPLIHRDVKSANILLNCTYTPKLCDFGLIKLSPSQNTSTATTVLGTSAYMAPEAFRGDISVKMDTFSFGVVLLELLTSLPPVDETREGTDLVTHVGESCNENSISPLLDREAGPWTEDEINYDEEVYKIALMCLEEKKKRPIMVTVRDLLSDLTKRFFE